MVTSAIRVRRAPGDLGFTLAEMLVVVALLAIGSAIAIPITMQSVKRGKNDSALTVVQTFLDSAHDKAVSERRNFEITFPAVNKIRVQRVEVPSGLKTTVDELQLEAGQEFYRFSGMPDTPDAFGGATATQFSGPAPVMFTSDGSLIDSAGDVTNGTVFVGKPGQPDTARAVTVYGITGLLRSYKWRGASWLE
jgi:prepilin-type N-terminal cleavage/methylation domain-containing protein